MEVENIILDSLRSVGCGIPDKATFKDFDPNVVVNSVIVCLKHVYKQAGDDAKASTLPKGLPAEMSAKFRVCSNLAKSVTDLGYTGELGYNHFLYPNPPDTKKLFSFLVEKLPKNEEREEEAARATTSSLRTQMLQRIFATEEMYRDKNAPRMLIDEMAQAGFPNMTCVRSSPVVAPPVQAPSTKAVARYIKKRLPFITEQPTERATVISSVMQANSLSYARMLVNEDIYGEDVAAWDDLRARKRVAMREKMMNIVSASTAKIASSAAESFAILSKTSAGIDLGVMKAQAQEEEKPVLKDAQTVMKERDAERAQEIEELTAKLEELESTSTTLAKENAGFTSALAEMERHIKEILDQTSELADELTLKQKTIAFLDNPEESTAELKKINTASAERILSLAKEWEGHRGLLLAKYLSLKKAALNMKDSYKQKVDQVKDLRAESKRLIEEIKDLEERLQAVTKEYEAMPKTQTRSSYTKRINEIIKNVKKQNVDIDSILADTRAMSKQLTVATDALEKTCKDAEEIIRVETEKGAKSTTELCATSMRLLTELKTIFAQFNSTGDEVSSVANITKDLEAQIEQLSVVVNALNIEGIEKDLKELKEETKKMQSKLKKKQNRE